MTTTTPADANRDRPHRLAAMKLRHAAMITLAGLLLAGCSPEPTPAEPTPVPEEEPTPQVVAGDATELRDAIQRFNRRTHGAELDGLPKADWQRTSAGVVCWNRCAADVGCFPSAVKVPRIVAAEWVDGAGGAAAGGVIAAGVGMHFKAWASIA